MRTKAKFLQLYVLPVMLLFVLYLLWGFSYRIYYDPLCQGYAQENGWRYVDYTPARRSSPGECIFEKPDGNLMHVEEKKIPKTPADYARQILTNFVILPLLWLMIFFFAALALIGIHRERRGHSSNSKNRINT